MSTAFTHAPLAPQPQPATKRPGSKGLRISAPGDAFEREADRVADTVMSGGKIPQWSLAKMGGRPVQRQAAPDAPTNQPAPAPAPQPNNYKDATSKLGEAFLQTDLGKKLKDAASQDPLVKGAEDFLSTLPGKIVAGTAAAGVVTGLTATHQPLPKQVPEIPLDMIRPGLKVKIDYEGPVDHPTKAMVTFSFSPQGERKKPAQTEAERYRTETARMAAEQERFRQGLKYAPGSPQAQQQEAEQKAISEWELRRLGGVLPGTAGRPLVPPQAGQSSAGGQQQSGAPWSFSPLANPEMDKKLDLQPATPGSGAILQRKCACQESGAGGECEECKKEKALQRKAAHSACIPEIPSTVDEVLHSPGKPLDEATRKFFEPRFHYDFSKVRVHADRKAAESADAVNALAYTSGSNVVFAQGKYAPQSQTGKQLLAHELAHVVQQGGAPASRNYHVLGRDTQPEREARAAGESVLSNRDTAIKSSLSAGQIGRVEGDTKQTTPPGGGGAGVGAPPGPGGAGATGTGGAAKPQRLRFDILGADIPLVDFLSKEAKRARDPDMRVSSLDDMIKKLQEQAPDGSGKCIEHISIYNHGRPGYQRVAGGADKPGKGSSPLPDTGFSLDWLYQPANQAALAQLRRVFCCGASMDWLGCGVAGVEAQGGTRTKEEIEQAGKLGESEKASLQERYKEYGTRYQSEEDAQKHGASLQGATFGKVTIGTWADATCTSIRAATDFVFHDADKGTYRVGYRGEFLDLQPSAAGHCSCDAATGRIQGGWDPGKGIDPGTSNWQLRLAWFNQALQPASGSPNLDMARNWLLELLAEVAPQLEIPAGLPVGPKPEPWIDMHSTDPNYVARTYDYLALCNPNDIWKWIGLNRMVIQQTPAYTKTILNHELQHASDVYVAAFEYKLADGAPPPAPLDACKPGYSPKESDPFGKYVLDFRKWREAGTSELRHLEIYAGSAANNFQHFSPEEKLAWFSGMITEVPENVRASDPLPTELLVAGVFLNPLPYEASMRAKFEALLFKVVDFFIYGDNAERGVNLGKARTLINHFNQVWAINPGDRGMLAAGIANQEKKKSESKP